MEHSQSGMSHGMSRHMLIMVLCCLIPMAAIGAIAAMRIPLPDVLRYGVILLCPLSHFVLMAFTPASAPKRSAGADVGGHEHDDGGRGVGVGTTDKGESCH